MNTSNTHRFPILPPQPAIHDHVATHRRSRKRTRSRALSLLSMKSGKSSQSSFEPVKAQPVTFTGDCFDEPMACGSFVPNASAIAMLQAIVTPGMRVKQPRERFHTISHLERGNWHSTDSVPCITRTMSPSSSRSSSPSPSRHRPTRIQATSCVASSDLLPVLERLERHSKLCVGQLSCSTCKRSGGDFPRCPRCGAMWCSRECRLQGGKKHICKRMTAQ